MRVPRAVGLSQLLFASKGGRRPSRGGVEVVFGAGWFHVREVVKSTGSDMNLVYDYMIRVLDSKSKVLGDPKSHRRTAYACL